MGRYVYSPYGDHADKAGELDRQAVITTASLEGHDIAKSDYPYAVHRDRQSVEQLADEMFTQWWNRLDRIINDRWELGKLDGHFANVKKLYVVGFTNGYLNAVGRFDEERETNRRKRSAPQQEALAYINDTGDATTRKRIRDEGKARGKAEVEAMYPDVVRDRLDIDDLAQRMINKWFATNRSKIGSNFTDDRREYDNLWIMGFRTGYEDEIAIRDKKVGKVAPQDAEAVLKKVERRINEYAYHIEITDPRYVDEPLPAEIYLPLKEDETE